ncbi:GIY-YIG nuclease family protein [Paenibacillus sp. CC-CFT747]|nr:GIY-YIG nuclease family protein [Paenibacillus sp. CC-CFT747]
MSFLFVPKRYPESPGCYLMKSSDGRIIYVGKAKNLRNRLRSYFRGNLPKKRTRQLVAEIADIEVVLVNNESESLLLENNLIKQYKPYYNRALKKDNSGYAYLKLTDEPYPRFDVYYRNRKGTAREKTDAGRGGETRKGRPEKPYAAEIPGERRFGPYASSRFRNALLEFLVDHYKIRSCRSLPKRVCLLYHIGKCSGICEGRISDEEYARTLAAAASLLENQGAGLLQEMNRQMERYSENLEFEKANNMLHHIRLLEKTYAKQIVDREAAIDQDVLYFGQEEVMITKLREGMVRDFVLLGLDKEWSRTRPATVFFWSSTGEAASGRAHRQPARQPGRRPQGLKRPARR